MHVHFHVHVSTQADNYPVSSYHHPRSVSHLHSFPEPCNWDPPPPLAPRLSIITAASPAPVWTTFCPQNHAQIGVTECKQAFQTNQPFQGLGFPWSPPCPHPLLPQIWALLFSTLTQTQVSTVLYTVLILLHLNNSQTLMFTIIIIIIYFQKLAAKSNWGKFAGLRVNCSQKMFSC